ncbi:hypothetical protein [Gluconobacter cerinus]|uniref:hypothetical protein n=1 Tax=Gluconobacter cerinus TaxID=38307 RepID=UPI001B8B4E29|nr:hypothetical protein [Gluconobacter cerinus]MBS1044508.1 hypothetical protein [Gluconobacter cerinus]
MLAFVWDALKAVVPAGVAWVAYKVSIEAKDATQAQRDIAANQYKISLYEARSQAINRIENWIRENEKYKFETINDHYEIINLFSNLNNLFDGKIEYENIKISVANLFVLHMQFIEMENSLSLCAEEDEYDEVKIKDLSQKIISDFQFLKLQVQTLLHQVRNLLIVPEPP